MADRRPYPWPTRARTHGRPAPVSVADPRLHPVAAATAGDARASARDVLGVPTTGALLEQLEPVVARGERPVAEPRERPARDPQAVVAERRRAAVAEPVQPHDCDEASELGREGYHAYCRGGVPIKGKRDSFEHKHHEFNFVYFRLSSANTLVDFHYADRKIVRQVHVSSDRFHETCDDGYCISGEWFSTRRMSGQIRNPNHVRADYRAELVG
jgi:hypothetical protein